MEQTERDRERAVRKSVRKLLPGFWGYVAASGVISLVIQLVGLVPTVLMQRMIDTLIPAKAVSQILFYIVLFCCIPLAVTLLSAFYRYQLAIVCRRLGLKLAVQGFENLLGQPMPYFDTTNSSELAAYCRGESMKYISFWLIEIPQLAATGLCGIVVMGYLLSLHWGVALFLLLYIPVAFFPSNWFAGRVQDCFAQNTKSNAKMLQIIDDTFRGIRSVKAMVLEKARIGKLREVSEETVSIWSKIALYDNMSGIWVDNFSDSVFTGVSFGMTAYLIVMGKMTLGSLAVVLNYTAKFLGIVKQFMHTNYDFKAQLGEYQKLFQILTMPAAEGEGDLPLRFTKELRFEQVTFAYTEERGDILKSLDLTVKSGEWLGIVGASGAGKTTIFDLLLRFYEPQAGRITLDGIDLGRISAGELRSGIAKVSQETFLFPGTIRENLLLAKPGAGEEELKQVLKSVRLDKFTGELDTEIGENGLSVSGGERQKLGLAQGLLRACQVILLDEVTANVDRDSEREIKEVLGKLHREKGLTIIAISHRIDFLADVDRIVVLEDGSIKEETVYQEYAKRYSQST